MERRKRALIMVRNIAFLCALFAINQTVLGVSWYSALGIAVLQMIVIGILVFIQKFIKHERKRKAADKTNG